ncbi:hypothetical protein [Mycoplasma sp. 1654_15]|uniref:hypothetical protein n=1 Tax=Mycoplasma sp. 1654_15 TaxID=2725994 RepID=UPI001449F3DB|nr:hypothetical protein [Mycoplasma sp. 1654_15]QJB71447.1 hypothetical protein HF996_03185 [Mycoplasma sp. 1654_15]
MFKKYKKYDDKINSELNNFQEIADFEANTSDLIVVNYIEKQRKSARNFFIFAVIIILLVIAAFIAFSVYMFG